jgi:hypothetical protein
MEPAPARPSAPVAGAASLRVGQTPRAFELLRLDGTPLHSDSLRGAAVLLVYLRHLY